MISLKEFNDNVNKIKKLADYIHQKVGYISTFSLITIFKHELKNSGYNITPWNFEIDISGQKVGSNFKNEEGEEITANHILLVNNSFIISISNTQYHNEKLGTCQMITNFNQIPSVNVNFGQRATNFKLSGKQGVGLNEKVTFKVTPFYPEPFDYKPPIN